MNNTPQNQIDSRVIGAFFSMSEDDLTRFAEELDVQMNLRELQFCQRYFKHAYRRPPIVAELRFIATYLAARRATPLRALPFDLTFAEEKTARAFADMAQKSAVTRSNAKNPADILSLLNASGDYLRRAGHAPYKNDLLCLNKAELALMTSTNRPKLSLDLGDQTAALISPNDRAPILPATLLIIDEQDPNLLPQVTAKIMEITARIGVTPLMQLGNEGLFPAITALPCGIEIFAPIVQNTVEDPYRTMNELYQNALLLTLPSAVVPSILATGIPLKSIASLREDDAVVIRHPHATVSLDKRLLHELNTLACSQLHGKVPQAQSGEYTIGEVRSKDEILCAMTGSGDPTASLLALLTAAFKAGAEPKKIHLCATLTCNKENLLVALADVAALHRTTTELALASQVARVITSDDAEPRLTVALTAPLLTSSPDDTKIAAFENAAACTDYAALRALLY